MRRFICILFIMCIGIVSFAQKTEKVEETYTYRCTDEIPIVQAKRTALERAQLEAIANTFGTQISQHNSTRVTNSNGTSDVDFLSLSSSDVQGEWIETIGEPHYDISYEQDMLVVTCKVKGIIREIVSAAIDIKAKVLRNGTEDRFESSEFRSGDDMYLSFQSPVDGYLAVYLIDNNGDAFCLLPYRNQTDGIYKVKSNTPYIFFSEKKAPQSERTIVDEYTLTCDDNMESNQIYVIFSPNPFVKANDTDMGESLPREIGRADFQKWLAKVRRKDQNANIYLRQIMITK